MGELSSDLRELEQRLLHERPMAHGHPTVPGRGLLYVATKPGEFCIATVDTNGNAVGSIGPCPEGYEWQVERETCWSNTTATTGLLEVYVQRIGAAPIESFTKLGRQDVAINADVKNDVSDLAPPMVIPPGYLLVAVWSGLNTGDQVALSTQIAVYLYPMIQERKHWWNRHEHPVDEGPIDQRPAL